MIQGASTPSSQLTPDSRMLSPQQSEPPLVPVIEPQPTPAHWPLHASAQQMVPSLFSTPARPLEQVDGSTSGEKTKSHEIDVCRNGPNVEVIR